MPNLRQRAQARLAAAAAALAAQRRLLTIHRDRILAEASAGIGVVVEEVQRMDDFFAILFPAVEDVAPTPLPAPLPTSTAVVSIGAEHTKTRKRKLAISIGNRAKDAFAEEEMPEQKQGQKQEQEEKIVGGGQKDKKKSDGDDDDDGDDDYDDDDVDGITWVDAENVEEKVQVIAPAAALSSEDARALLAAVPPAGVELSSAATSAALLRNDANEDILTAVRDHTLHVSRSVLPKVQGWMNVLVRAQATLDPNANLVIQQSADMMLRRIALLNGRLYRLLANSGKFFNENFFSQNREGC